MPPVISQHIVFITVSDLDASSRFYTGLFGLRLARDQGPCRIYHICGDAYIGFVKGKPPASSEGVALCFVTDEVDALYRKAESLGLKVLFAPRLNEKFQIYHFFIKGPDDYLVEVQRFLDPLA